MIDNKSSLEEIEDALQELLEARPNKATAVYYKIILRQRSQQFYWAIHGSEGVITK